MSGSQRHGVDESSNNNINNNVYDDDEMNNHDIELNDRSTSQQSRGVVRHGLTTLVTRSVQQVGRRGQRQRHSNYNRIDNSAISSSTTGIGNSDATTIGSTDTDGVWNDGDDNDIDDNVGTRNGPSTNTAARIVSQRLANIARVRLGANSTTRRNIERLGLTRVESTDIDDVHDSNDDNNSNNNYNNGTLNSSVSTVASGSTRQKLSNRNLTSSSIIPMNGVDNPLAINDNGSAMPVSMHEAELDKNSITVTILDFMHQKFQVTVPMDGTILDLKRCGYLVHKVPVSRQRLIYLGKLLADDSTLVSSKIISNGITIHLFPKPRVIVVDSNNNTTNAGKSNSSTNSTSGDSTTDGNTGTNDNDTDNDNNNNNSAGARVPTIVMNSDEAERRSHILVLGSPDYLEAQNNVKLFSFMLLIISSIEILNILTIALKIPETEQQQQQQEGSPSQPEYNINVDDDIIFNPFGQDMNITINNTNSYYYNNTNPADVEHDILHNISSTTREEVFALYTQWSWLTWFDLAISIIGVYVAMLGIRATNDNQLRVAKQYLYGTCTTAFGWLLYNYIITFEADEIIDHGLDLFSKQQSNYTNIPPNGYNSNGGYYNDDALYNQYSNGLNNNGESTTGSSNDPTNNKDQSVYMQALQVLLIPAMVWIVCILRAYQFSSLLQEAELEAENRIREELRLAVDDDDDDNDDSIIDTTGTNATTTSSTTTSGTTSNQQSISTSSISNDIESAQQVRRQQQQQQQFLPSFLINETRQRLLQLQQQQRHRSSYNNSNRGGGGDNNDNSIRETELTVVTSIPIESATTATMTTNASVSNTTTTTTTPNQRTPYFA